MTDWRREVQEDSSNSTFSESEDDSSGSATTEDSVEEDEESYISRERPKSRKARKCSPGSTKAMHIGAATVQCYEEFLNGRTKSYHSKNPMIRIHENANGEARFDFPNQPSGAVGIVTYTPEGKLLQARFAQVEENILHNLTGATQQLFSGPMDNIVDSQLWLREILKKLPSMEKLYDHQCDVLGRPSEHRTEIKCLRKPQQPPPSRFEPFMPTSIAVPIHKREINNWLLERMKGSYAFYFRLRDRVNACRDATTDKMIPEKMQSLITAMRSLEGSEKAAVLLGADFIRSLASRQSYLFRNPVARKYVSKDTYDTRFFAESYVKHDTSPEAVNFGITFKVPPEGVISSGVSHKAWITSENKKGFGAFRPQDGLQDELPNLPSFPKHLAPLLPKYQEMVGKVLAEFLKKASHLLKIPLQRHVPPSTRLASVLSSIEKRENALGLDEDFLLSVRSIFGVLIAGHYEELWEHIRHVLPGIYELVEDQNPHEGILLLETLRVAINPTKTGTETEKKRGYRVHVSLGNDKAKTELTQQRGNSVRSNYFTNNDGKYHASVLTNKYHDMLKRKTEKY
jgi:hypothetical protein